MAWTSGSYMAGLLFVAKPGRPWSQRLASMAASPIPNFLQRTGSTTVHSTGLLDGPSTPAMYMVFCTQQRPFIRAPTLCLECVYNGKWTETMHPQTLHALWPYRGDAALSLSCHGFFTGARMLCAFEFRIGCSIFFSTPTPNARRSH
jgi:hypothetical protein